ncbi:MAG TPA: PxKF domain-containing protein, partial [Chloroflexaceae bacterium]|nr:PxKF domain-containing protein [Chloroflexaceae bacterium]
KFQENDSNDFSSSGAISYISPSQLNARLRSIQEDYPPMAFKAMMNLAGSHDTQRLRFLLKKVNNDNDGAAVQRMKEWWLFAFTYAGAPTLYYGDEVGLSHDGVWDGDRYQDDPYNRAPFPWPDASGGSYVPDTANLQVFARHMASLRQSYGALQDGDVQHGLVIDDARQLYGFARTNGDQTALVLLNRSGGSHSATFSGLNAAPYNLPDGTVLLDAIGGATYSVSGGAVTVSVTPTWGAVLVEQGELDTPAAAALSAAAAGPNVQLAWPAVIADGAGDPEVVTRYEVHRGASAGFAPGAGTLLATVAPPDFGSPGGVLGYSDAGAASGGSFYAVRACNAAGRCSTTPAVAPTKQSADLAVDAASGVYGGSVDLRATLSAGGAPLAGYTVSFSLNGQLVGTAVTDASGVAQGSASLGAIGAGSYPAGVAASFAGDGAYNPASASGALTVAPAAATVSLSGLSHSYDGGAKAATVATSPAGLSVSVTYDGATAAPVNAGSYAVAATVTDPNYAGSASGTLVIAQAEQSVSLTGVPATATAGASFSVGATASSGLAVTLSVSGPCSLSGATVTTTAAGTCVVTATQAGDGNYNPASASASVAVAPAGPSYSFTGFFEPVNNPPTLNTMQAGRAVPVKFSLGGDFGLNIFAQDYPASRAVNCSSGTVSDSIEQTVTAGASSLSYDAATGVYTYVWKTDKGWANTCRELVVRLSDGSVRTALFSFRR